MHDRFFLQALNIRLLGVGRYMLQDYRTKGDESKKYGKLDSKERQEDQA